MPTAEMISCQEFVELVTDYLEGALAPGDLRRLEEHLAACGKCSEYLAQFRATIELAGRLTPDDVSPEAEAALLEVFRAWRGEQEGSEEGS